MHDLITGRGVLYIEHYVCGGYYKLKKGTFNLQELRNPIKDIQVYSEDMPS